MKSTKVIAVLGIILAAAVLLAWQPAMAGVTVVEDRTDYVNGLWSGGLRTIQWRWVTDTTTTTAEGAYVNNVTGTIIGIKAVPNATTSPPDASYDIDIKDTELGHDVLNGAGDNLPTSKASDSNRVRPQDSGSNGDIVLFREQLGFFGSNLGTNAAADFYLYIKLP